MDQKILSDTAVRPEPERPFPVLPVYGPSLVWRSVESFGCGSPRIFRLPGQRRPDDQYRFIVNFNGFNLISGKYPKYGFRQSPSHIGSGMELRLVINLHGTSGRKRQRNAFLHHHDQPGFLHPPNSCPLINLRMVGGEQVSADAQICTRSPIISTVCSIRSSAYSGIGPPPSLPS